MPSLSASTPPARKIWAEVLLAAIHAKNPGLAVEVPLQSTLSPGAMPSINASRCQSPLVYVPSAAKGGP